MVNVRCEKISIANVLSYTSKFYGFLDNDIILPEYLLIEFEGGKTIFYVNDRIFKCISCQKYGHTRN